MQEYRRFKSKTLRRDWNKFGFRSYYRVEKYTGRRIQRTNKLHKIFQLTIGIPKFLVKKWSWKYVEGTGK